MSWKVTACYSQIAVVNKRTAQQLEELDFNNPLQSISCCSVDPGGRRHLSLSLSLYLYI